MIRKAARSLPCVIGVQYILTAVVEETEDTIIYEATQKDLQREVLVESLRLSAMADEHRRAAFLETCRLQARVRHTSLAAVLQLLEAEETLHVARERIKGEPLDMMVSTGRVLSAEMVCNLLQQMCYVYLFFDMERIASRPFSPQHTYLMDFGGFRFDHLAVAGVRRRGDTQRQMSDMVQVVAPLLDRSSAFAAPLLHIMEQINSGRAWSSITPAALDEELIRLQMEMLRRR